MKIVVSVLVCSIWATVMVTTQDYTQIESPASCEYEYTYRGPSQGIFQSPEFPNKYPERTRCRYFFQAREKGRIRIQFDFFDLETSDDDCKYDYLEFSNFNEFGIKEMPTTRYCGKSKPPEYISTRSRMDIIFFSDVTTNAMGFFGHFEFLDTNWHPFPLSTIGCGDGYLTGPGGVVLSPNYPSEYPTEAGCTWIINVKETEQILLHFTSLDITSTVKCQEANSLMVFEGFVTPDTMPISYCGQLNQEPDTKKEYLSQKNRLVLRFQSGVANTGNHIGFQAIWTAVTFGKKGQCGERFECRNEVPGACMLMPEQELCNTNHYCIHQTLTCNDVANCGANDNSDENKCLYYILKYVGYIGGPAVGVIIIIITSCCCWRRRCRRGRERGVRYSVPKEQQSLSQSATHSMMSTHSSNLHVRSLDHSPRSSCVMYTTAFTDASPLDHHSNCKLADNNKPPPEPAEHHPPGNSVPYPNNTSSFIPDMFEEEHSKSYRGHQKRPSYHMMKELYYDDGKIVTANI